MTIIFLENPVLCDETLPQLVFQMEMFSTRLSGIAHCIVPKLPVDSSVLLQPPIPLLPQILNAQLPIGSNPIMIPPPSIVQIIVPLQKNTFEEGMEHQNDQQKLPPPPILTSTEQSTTSTTQESLPSAVTIPSTENYQKLQDSQNISYKSNDESDLDINNKIKINSEQIKLDENSNDIPVDKTVSYNAELIEPEEMPDINQKI